jgi:pilus assembly protein TadC
MTGLIIKLVSSVSAFGAMTAFLYWILQSATLAHGQGQTVLESLKLNPELAVKQSRFLHIATQLGFVFLPLVKRWENRNAHGIADSLKRVNTQLVKANLRHKLMPEQFLSASLSLAVAGGISSAICAYLFGFGMILAMLMGFPSGAIFGFFLPGVMLKNYIADRVSLIEKRLPFAIEFMLLAMEANAAFPGAIRVYCEQMADDPLAEQLRIVLRDIEDGFGAQDALARFGERIESDALSGFVLSVTTGIETGQPIKEVLKAQADATRLRRYQDAESIAKSATTRAIFPLFIVMIAVLLLLLVPLIIKLTQESFL